MNPRARDSKPSHCYASQGRERHVSEADEIAKITEEIATRERLGRPQFQIAAKSPT